MRACICRWMSMRVHVWARECVCVRVYVEGEVCVDVLSIFS